MARGPDRNGLIETVRNGCAAAGVFPSDRQVEQLLSYTEEVLRWGRRINLTGARDVPTFIERHLIDAVTILPYLDITPGSAWGDAGSGAGLPGLPLAILTPDTAWHLVEPREKRWAFLVHVVHTLNLTNVTIHRARIEDAPLSPGSLHGVISRALGLAVLATFPWLKEGGTLAVVTGESLNHWGRAAAGLPLTPQEPVPLPHNTHLLLWVLGARP